MSSQISLFDGNQNFKIDKPIRLIELFALCRNRKSSKGVEELGCGF